MIRLHRTKDLGLIRSIITNPAIYGRMSDDFAPPPDQYQPIENEEMVYVAVEVAGVTQGIWAFIPHNRIMYEAHTCLLPAAWGAVASVAAKLMAEWMWRETQCRRLITSVPEFNRTALRFARSAGMTEWGRNPMSYQKHGRLYDQIMLGMSKPEAQADGQDRG